MVAIMINKRDLKNLLAWAGSAKVRAYEVGIPFDHEEEETLLKLRRANLKKIEP